MQITSSKELAKNAKKGDMVKIENHCTKKIRLGYLPCVILTCVILHWVLLPWVIFHNRVWHWGIIPWVILLSDFTLGSLSQCGPTLGYNTTGNLTE